jgi:hypothetical protein
MIHPLSTMPTYLNQVFGSNSVNNSNGSSSTRPSCKRTIATMINSESLLRISVTIVNIMMIFSTCCHVCQVDAFAIRNNNNMVRQGISNNHLLQRHGDKRHGNTIELYNNLHRKRENELQQFQSISSLLLSARGGIHDSKENTVAVATDDDDKENVNNNNYVWVAPVQSVVDNVTGGWGLSYADLSPDNDNTIAGRTFLASNIAYFIGGAILTVQGDVWLGFCTELCAIASFNYHYQQLVNTGTNSTSPEVRLALLVDYVFALLSILTALVYFVTNPATFTGEIPFYTIGLSFLACVCLGLSWVWEYGKPYMFWHSLWHLFSAYAGYVVGTEHYYNTLPPP